VQRLSKSFLDIIIGALLRYLEDQDLGGDSLYNPQEIGCKLALKRSVNDT
jgi:hypothetical protein